MGSMVFMNQSQLSKIEGDLKVRALIQNGKHRLTDIKNQKLIPRDFPLSVKD